ncbi:Glutamate--tRNA ligase [uncultured archaeon]|nr:Glutamate--tRNA ligase [uncultured archaeon]
MIGYLRQKVANMELNQIIRKWALKNAHDYGKADMGSVVGKVIAEMPEAKKDMKSAMKRINDMVEEVNGMKKPAIEKALKEFEFQEKPKEEERRIRLPPHPEGNVVTRFAPEPSGYAHIGHAKAVLLSWEAARENDGRFILRIDDTNPVLAKQEFVDSWKDILAWLGVDWDAESFTSDSMDMFYAYALELIKRGKAYVCECTAELIKLNREGRKPCACRNKVEMQNVKDFERMTTGGFKEGKAILRYKGDMRALNSVMRDPTLVRIVEEKHFRQEDRYSAWPSYDFVTPILDATQGVTHAIRSKEYELRDELYYAIIDDLEIRKPIMLSISRLVVKNNSTQKRVIRKLVQENVIDGWDDPRLLTMIGMRRRGIQPAALREFALSFGGISTSESKEATIDPLLHANRKILDPVSKRMHFVKDPIVLIIKGFRSEVDLPFHSEQELGSRNLSVNEKVLVNRDDIKEGEILRLRDLCNVGITEIVGNSANGRLIETKEMPAKKIQWVPADSAAKVRILRPLELMDGDVPRKDSMQVDAGFCEAGCKELKEGDIVQFVRYGFVRKEKSGPNGELSFVFSC